MSNWANLYPTESIYLDESGKRLSKWAPSKLFALILWLNDPQALPARETKKLVKAADTFIAVENAMFKTGTGTRPFLCGPERGRWPPGLPPRAVCLADGQKGCFCLRQARVSAVLLNFLFSSYVQKSQGGVESADSFSYCTNKQNGEEDFFQFSISSAFISFFRRVEEGGEPLP